MIIMHVMNHHALPRHVPAGAAAWRQRLARIDADVVEAVMAGIRPDRMSAVCRQFTLDLLVENRRRILRLGEP